REELMRDMQIEKLRKWCEKSTKCKEKIPEFLEGKDGRFNYIHLHRRWFEEKKEDKNKSGVAKLEALLEDITCKLCQSNLLEVSRRAEENAHMMRKSLK